MLTRASDATSKKQPARIIAFILKLTTVMDDGRGVIHLSLIKDRFVGNLFWHTNYE